MKAAQHAVVGRARIPKSRQGRPKVAHGFNRGLRVEKGQSPSGAKEKMGLDRCVLSSLTGLVLYSRRNPAMNRWAILERPSGTWNHDTPNRYSVSTLGSILQPSLRDLAAWPDVSRR